MVDFRADIKAILDRTSDSIKQGPYDTHVALYNPAKLDA